MNAPTLSGDPRLSTQSVWSSLQRLDIQGIWLDIKRIFDLSKRSTGLTGAIATGTAVSHGLGFVPNFVMLQPQDGTPTNYFADTYTSTQFTVHFTGGGSHAFGWSAEQ